MAAAYDPARHYDRVTAAWTLLLGRDLHYGLFFSGTEDLTSATAALTECMTRACRIEPGVEVLDVGCGTGGPACHLAARHGARVTGITTSAVGLEAARRTAAAQGLESVVSFERRDGTDNGFAEETFDRVWVLESSHLMRRRERLLSESARVLKRGGWFALCDIVLRRPMDLGEVRRLRRPLALLREAFGDARMEPLDRYAEHARHSGLTVEEQLDLTELTRPTFRHWRENAHRHREAVVAQLGEPEWQRFVEACSVLERFWDGGTLGYGLLTARKD